MKLWWIERSGGSHAIEHLSEDISEKKQKETRKQVDALLKLGIIKKS